MLEKEVKKSTSIIVPDFFVPNITLLAGVDESNNGRIPVYYTGVMSTNPRDVTDIITKEKIRNHKKLFSRFSHRNYSFLQLNGIDIDRIPRNQKIGTVVASLLNGEIEPPIEVLGLYLDGEYLTPEKLYLRDLISEVYSLKRKNVHLFCGARYDTKIRLVQLADELAHYFFRNCPQEKLSRNPHRKELIM